MAWNSYSLINLKRPETYDPKDGARFEVHYEKTRGFYGEDALPFEVQMIVEGDNIKWDCSNVKGDRTQQVVDLTNEGKAQHEIVDILGMDKSNVSRHVKKAKDNNMFEDSSHLNGMF